MAEPLEGWWGGVGRRFNCLTSGAAVGLHALTIEPTSTDGRAARAAGRSAAARGKRSGRRAGGRAALTTRRDETGERRGAARCGGLVARCPARAD